MTPTLSRAPGAPLAADDPVALRIRTLRMSQGLSYKKLSEAAGGLATSFLFNIEHERKVPGEDVAARIARALGDGAYEQLYRAWARGKSRGRGGRAAREARLGWWGGRWGEGWGARGRGRPRVLARRVGAAARGLRAARRRRPRPPGRGGPQR